MLEFDRIYNSDCIEGMKQIESGKVDLIVTDPPYCISYKTGGKPINEFGTSDILSVPIPIEGNIEMKHGGEPSAYLIGWIASCINKARLGIGDFVEIVDKEEK